MAEKNDVFVGNLTFNTTEEQLREKFSFVGSVKSVRILMDKETGKPKGFAFVEYYDTNSALAAIKHLDQTELNGRKIKVGYPSQSNLKDIARQIGHIVPEPIDTAYGTNLQNVISNMKLHEAWDALEAMKKLVTDDRKGQKVRAMLEQHPNLIHAMYEIQKRLGIVLPAHLQQQQVRVASNPQPSANSASVAGAGGMGAGNVSNKGMMQSAGRFDSYEGMNMNANMMGSGMGGMSNMGYEQMGYRDGAMDIDNTYMSGSGNAGMMMDRQSQQSMPQAPILLPPQQSNASAHSQQAYDQGNMNMMYGGNAGDYDMGGNMNMGMNMGGNMNMGMNMGYDDMGYGGNMNMGMNDNMNYGGAGRDGDRGRDRPSRFTSRGNGNEYYDNNDYYN